MSIAIAPRPADTPPRLGCDEPGNTPSARRTTETSLRHDSPARAVATWRTAKSIARRERI
jgi:hypothetical protein